VDDLLVSNPTYVYYVVVFTLH